MKKAEAIEYMKNGYKVTHTYFDENEFMTINPENNNILLEDGCECSIREFFKIRNDESWDEGYELFESIKPSYLDILGMGQSIYPYHMIDRDMCQMKDWGLSKKQREANILPVRTEPKIGRNEPCPCGSGKKNKQCCKQF